MISIEVPLPDSLNKYLTKHWAVRSKEKNELCQDIYYMLCEQLKCPLPTWKKARLKYTIHSSRMTDADNRVIIPKLVNDCIVRAELVPDDSPKYLEYGLPEFVYDKENRFVIVEIEEVR